MATKFRKIATEEAFSIPEVAAALKEVARSPSQSLDKNLVKGIYDPAKPGEGYNSLDFLSGLLQASRILKASATAFSISVFDGTYLANFTRSQ